MNDAIDGLSPLVATEVIVPFFVEAALQSSSASNFTVLRVLRLTRLFRLVKLGKSFEVLQIIGRVFHKSIAMFWFSRWTFLWPCASQLRRSTSWKVANGIPTRWIGYELVMTVPDRHRLSRAFHTPSGGSSWLSPQLVWALRCVRKVCVRKRRRNYRNPL